MNIDEMPAGREMDALLAQAMGWFKYDDTGGLFEYWCRKRTKKDYPHQTEDWLERYPVVSTGYSVEPVDNIEDLGILSGLIHRGVWNPSTNLAAAHKVIDRLDELYAAWFEIRGPRGWLAQCNCPGKQYIAVASTLSHAICRVALKVARSEQHTRLGPNLTTAILSSLPGALQGRLGGKDSEMG